MNIDKQKLEMVTPVDADPIALARICVDVAGQAGVARKELALYERYLSIDRMEKEIASKRHFLLEALGFTAHYGRSGNYNHGYLTIEGVTPDALRMAAERIMAEIPFVSARLFDVDYEYWQNADDPATYAVAGRSVDGLPMRHNGLPPPLDQVVVDTTRNPGRQVTRDGYVEAIGHRMWLGREFFERVPGVSKEAVRNVDWLAVIERPTGPLEITAAEHPFRDDSNAEQQVRLRRLLFPTTVDRRSTRQGWDVA